MADDPTPPVAPATRPSQGPPPSSAAASRAPSAGLSLFVEALQEADALSDLDDASLARLAEDLDDPREDVLRLDLLAAYYGDDGGPGLARRRMDRFAMFRADDGSTARDVVELLGSLLTEVDGVVLERLGGDDGPLVLRSGEAIGPVVDDKEERRDTDEIDLDELDEEVETVAIRSLVRAANALLRQAEVARRLIALRADPTREAYFGATREQAERLFEARCLEEPTLDAVLDLAGWTTG